MFEGLRALLNSADLAPHGMCLLWRPELIWLHVLSDLAIGLAYFSIPIVLVWFVLNRRDLAFGWVFWLFAVFILACGTTHFLNIWTLWNPDYGTEGLVKGLTAVASILTAIALWPLLPKALALPSPVQLARLNTELQTEVQQRREAEARLRASEAQYYGFFTNLAEGLFVLEVSPDGDFRYETINPALARATGLSADEFRGRKPEDFFTPEHARDVRRRYAECLAAGQPIDYEEQVQVPSGMRSWHTVLVPLRDADGRITRILGSARDITERQRLQGELTQASKLATVGTLAAGIAHEMSQPLNIMSMWAQNALRRLEAGSMDPAFQTRVLTIVREQAQRMAAVIDHMRTLSRRDTGGTERFDPAESVRSAIDLVRGQYELAGVHITADMPQGSCEVLGRPVQLEQVILNLLSNARDAVLAKGDSARIRAAMQLGADGATVDISITDNGGGIPPEIMDRLFDPFFTMKEAGRGTGLGLSVSYNIVAAMRGRISAENVTTDDGSRGARFRIILPVAEPGSERASVAG